MSNLKEAIETPIKKPLAQVLWILSEFPGYCTDLFAALAKYLSRLGVNSVFVSASPYYERFRGIDLKALGPVHDISSYLSDRKNREHLEDENIDYWLTHATFVRIGHFWGRHINNWDDYRCISRFYRELFQKHGPFDAVVSEAPSNAVVCFSAVEAERHRVPFLGLMTGRIPGCFNVFTDIDGTRLLENPSPLMDAPDEHVDLNVIMDAQLNKIPTRTILAGALKKIWRASGVGLVHSPELAYPAVVQMFSTCNMLFRKARHSYTVHVDRAFSSCPPIDPTYLNILFPLHFRPEASTSVQARYYEDDFNTLRNISFSLPPRSRLYVREHPAAIGTHSLGFYSAVRSLPSTYLMGPEPPLAPVLSKFDGLVCLTSTAGFEAIQQGVPVLLLGRTFYENYPHVRRIQGWEDLCDTLRSLPRGQDRKPDPVPMSIYLRYCFEGNFNYMQPEVLEPQNIAKLCVPIEIALQGKFQNP